MKPNILPADTFLVVNKTILNDQDRKILTMLYQPIIGDTATSLYFTLWGYLDKSEILSCEWTHHQIMTNMRLKLSEITEAFEKLEAIGLIRTYYKKNHVNHFTYILYSPLSVSSYVQNPILNNTLYNNVGMSEYDNIINYFRMPKIDLSDYIEVTKKFDEIFKSEPIGSLDNLMTDIKRKRVNELQIVTKIDINNVLDIVPSEILNRRSITNEKKNLIYKLSYIYDLADDELSDLIRNSIDDKHHIDDKKLISNAKNYYQFENGGKLPSIVYRNQPEFLRKPEGDTSPKAQLIYQFETTSPYDYLVRKNKSTRLSKKDQEILSYLAIDLDLKPGVINVLIDYVLKINNNKLIKNFIFVIAEQWSRSNIKTVEQAMDFAKQEYTKRRVIKKNDNEKEPVWFDQNIKKEEASIDEISELENFMGDL